MMSIIVIGTNMQRLKAREAEFDFIMPSHNGCPICNQYLDDFITAAKNILDGKPDLVATVKGAPKRGKANRSIFILSKL